MLGKITRFLVFLDDLAEVLVLHVLFSRKNWKKTTLALVTIAGLFYSGAWSSWTVSADSWAQRGYTALMKGDNANAIVAFEKAVEKAPDRALFHQRLGLAYLEDTNYERALKELQLAYKLCPSRTTLFYLGCTYQHMKLHDVAIGIFNQVRSCGSKEALLAEGSAGYEPVAEAKIGECYIKKGDLDRAIESLSRTIALYPNYPHAYFYLGVAHWEKGNPDLGVEQFFKVIELYPQESAAYYNVACYYSIKGIPDLALVWLEKAFKAGFNQFNHIRTDHDLDNIRDLVQFKELVGKYQKELPHKS
jgi:tetratricopeptide (TPR) repeat protein